MLVLVDALVSGGADVDRGDRNTLSMALVLAIRRQSMVPIKKYADFFF